MDNRYGTFSSSNIWKLLSKDRSGKNTGSQGVKYIKQVAHELRLGRAINKETSARATTWGKFIETCVFDKLDTSYEIISQNRLFHPTIPFYSGAPDVKKLNTTGDIKAPYSLEVFCDKINALTEGLETYKKEYPEDYWQHISSAVLLTSNCHPVTHFEAIIYVPYESDLKEIKELAMTDKDTYFIAYAEDNELPYLPENGYYKDLNKFRFEVPEADCELLKNAVIEAGKLLKNPTQIINIESENLLLNIKKNSIMETIVEGGKR